VHAMLLSTLLALQIAGSAPPQTAEPPAPQPPLIKPEGLPTVFLTDLRGIEYRGQLLRVDPAEVVLLGERGERTFKRSEIVQIEKRGDSLKNGALIGAAIGVTGGLFVGGFSDCQGNQQDGCAGMRVAMLLTSVGLYTAVGMGIDAAIKGRTIIYRAPAVTLTIRPSGASAGLTLRW
jgi:hypothetical protein